MKVSIHTLTWTNSNRTVLENHKKVMEHFSIPVNYTEENIHHGEWIDRVLNTADSDMFVFIDVDCVPLSKQVIDESILHCANGYLVGNAQVTNCIKAKHDLFCAPSFFVISKRYYELIGKPSAMNNSRSDVAQEITRAAVENEMRIKMYFPTSFQGVPRGGVWRLSSYGYYGIGTLYENKMYHLYQTRYAENVNLFVETCEHILNERIDSINRKYDSRSELMGVLPVEDEYGL